MKEVKGLTRTVGGSGVRPSSVMGRVRGGLSNREVGGGLVTTGKTVGGYSEGHTRTGGGGQGRHWGPYDYYLLTISLSFLSPQSFRRVGI